MKKNKLILRIFAPVLISAIALLILNVSRPILVRAAGTAGTAVQTVIAALTIRNISDLDFGVGAPSDPEKTIPPGSSETTENGSFQVFGEPSRPYSIILPADGSVKMRTGLGLFPDEIISVDRFTSFPSQSGLLGPAGESMLYIGATRSALTPKQKQGRYTGLYFVQVVY
jgi:hypothetical protein